MGCTLQSFLLHDNTLDAYIFLDVFDPRNVLRLKERLLLNLI